MVRVKQVDFLVYLPHLRAAFLLRQGFGGQVRRHMRRELDARGWQVDPAVWPMDWGVQIEPVGSGASAVKYLGAYVARTAIGDSRMDEVTEQSVTFRWRDRSHGNRVEKMTLPGQEFVARYLRHVLPVGLRSIRYYGFCHPAAKANRLRIQLLAGMRVDLGAQIPKRAPAAAPRCPVCRGRMRLIKAFDGPYRKRGPPRSRDDPAPQGQSHSIAA